MLVGKKEGASVVTCGMPGRVREGAHRLAIVRGANGGGVTAVNLVEEDNYAFIGTQRGSDVQRRVAIML